MNQIMTHRELVVYLIGLGAGMFLVSLSPWSWRRTAWVTLWNIFVGTVAIVLVSVTSVRASDAPPDLTSDFSRHDRECSAGSARACAQLREVTLKLSSRGFCYGRPADTLDWERRKTGWVRCGK